MKAAETATPDVRTIGGTLMEMKNITLRFGGVVVVVKNISFDIREGEIRAIIGPNRAGTSSMLNVSNGFFHPEVGEIWLDGARRKPMKPYQIARQGIVRTFQNIALFEGMGTLDNIMFARFTHMITKVFQHALWHCKAAREDEENRAIVEWVNDFLEIQAIRKTSVGSLPYGLQERVELGRALAAQPRLLMLDKPRAGINVEEKEEISRFILDLDN